MMTNSASLARKTGLPGDFVWDEEESEALRRARMERRAHRVGRLGCARSSSRLTTWCRSAPRKRSSWLSGSKQVGRPLRCLTEMAEHGESSQLTHGGVT